MATTVTKLPIINNILTGSSTDLVPSQNMTRNFGANQDFVEMHIFDPADQRIYSVSPFTGYKIPGNFQPTDTYSIQELEFTPDIDLQNLGIQFGDYKVYYNILRPKIVEENNKAFFIKEISEDRTEIRLSTNNVGNDVIESGTINFINEIQNLTYFKEFYLNFGENNLYPAVNIALDINTNPYSILVKLLNPLPINYNVNDSLLIVDEISNPQVFEVNIIQDSTPVTYPTLRGPNFDLDLDNLKVGPTPYYNFTEITSFQGNFAPQLQQLLGQLSASNFALNVDYTNYENFVHYSSAARRLEGFKYKLTNIEEYTTASSSLAESNSPTANLDAQNFQTKINETIQSFDGYEQYLYFESSSYAWPKSNSTKPYINYLTTDYQSLNWFYAQQEIAELYDDNNQNYILYTLPGYVAENTDNELVFNFVASIGQMFDDIWIHIKAITDLYKAKNALDEGISKDLVYFALQSMGINTYTDEDGTNQFQYLYGVDENGSYLPQTSSYETLVTASQYQLSGQDQQKGIYKRLYSNLPLLLKSKGTTRFVQYLNTIFGIPSTIMGSLEYGGVDKVTSSFEYEYDKFNYALQISGNDNVVTIPWTYTSQSKARTTYDDIVPNGVEFRFKGQQLPLSSVTQSLFYKGSSFKLDLIYANTGSNNSIYSGSTGNFGYLQFTLGSTSVSTPTVPVYTTGSSQDTSWYSVLVQRRNPDKRSTQTSDSQTYDVYIKNNIWGEVGHVASASLTTSNSTYNNAWSSTGVLSFGDGGVYPFSGSLQEVRLWSNYVSESAFDSHVLNPESIEGNFTTSSFADLTARFPLGNNLFTYNHSLTSSVSSVAPDQNIQGWTASFSQFPNKNNYTSFTETYYADVANSGYANPVTDKIRIVSGSEYGTQLMPNKSIEIQPLIPITKDIHLLDASLSPQDEIDRAIIAQFGSTYNLDDIIGNPETGSYNELTVLQTDFFKKFTNKYNYKDYIRLIEFFHNSLFRTLKDFTPARTNLSTGIVIKPHLLERSRVQRYNPTVDNKNNETVTINTAFFTGSNGGDYSQSLYPITYQGKLGKVTVTSDARDFFTGELPSASINGYDEQVNPFTLYTPYLTSSYSESIWAHEYDALLNNVSGSVSSSIRKRSCYITSGSKLTQLLETAYLQDFTYRYLRHKYPRYDGVKTTSTNYNFYIGADKGKGLYGKNASIDKNTKLFAFFSEIIATGSNLISMPERSNVYIKYLIDESGSLTELSQRDYDILSENQKYNLYQVQNIFKSGETLNINLFDKQNPTRQSGLDGNKKIFAGGYKYSPVLWKLHINEDLFYNLDQAAYPKGVPPGIGVAPISDFTVVPQGRQTGWLVKENKIKYKVIKNNGTAPNEDLLITYKVYIRRGWAPDFWQTLTGTMLAGTLETEWSFEYSNARDGGGHSIINVQTLNSDYDFDYSVTDPFQDNKLKIDSVNPSIISCSAAQATYYSNFHFSGSGIYSERTDYSFLINPGDLVRFGEAPISALATASFPQALEYEIQEVYPPNENLGGTTKTGLEFRINIPKTSENPEGKVPNAATSSVSSSYIPTYVFSRKIADETNIVIEYQKKPGQSSGGIVHNINLSESVQDKLADIVSELKSKIFSTVLIQ
jgi:hypothetical protein